MGTSGVPKRGGLVSRFRAAPARPLDGPGRPSSLPFGRPDPKIRHGAADREVIDHLAVPRREAEEAVNVVVEEGADPGRLEAEGFGGEVEALPDRAGLEVRVP